MRNLMTLAEEILALRKREQQLLEEYKQCLSKDAPKVGDKVRVFDFETPCDKVLKVYKLEFLHGEVSQRLPQIRCHLERKNGTRIYDKSYSPEMLEPWNAR